MGGTFSVGGLISGLDSNTLINQLMTIERAPIRRLDNRLRLLEDQRNAIRDIRTQLLALRNRVQDFRLSNVFYAFKTASNDEKVLTSQISAPNPVLGSFEVNVIQLASATVAGSSGVIGAAIAPDTPLSGSGMTTEVQAGTFTINGLEFTVDPDTDSLNDILAAINASAAGVTATYDAGTDKVLIANTDPGDTSIINFGATNDTSNFLSAIAVTGATQYTDGNGATAVTSTRHMGAVNVAKEMSAVNFAGGAVTAGVFTINGIEISVDPATDGVMDVIQRINSSDAGVTASYDSSTDTIRVVSKTLGSRTISFGRAGDTSNFLAIMNLDTAVQTAGRDSQFTVNGGPVQTRNTNEVADAIGGVTLNFLSVGTSTVTVSSDDDKIIEGVRAFIEEFNTSVSRLRELTATGGALAGDGGLRNIETYLRQNIFVQISGISGDFRSLANIGITTGTDFDPAASAQLRLDEDKFREALRTGRANVEALFTNVSGTGVGDLFFAYLDEATSITGYLNSRIRTNGSIDQQIRQLNDQRARIEDRLQQRETRLRRQFTRLEQMSASFQAQNNSLASLSQSFLLF